MMNALNSSVVWELTTEGETLSHFGIVGPIGIWGSGENGYLFSRALVIIIRDLGSKLIVLGFREPCQKVKK